MTRTMFRLSVAVVGAVVLSRAVPVSAAPAQQPGPAQACVAIVLPAVKGAEGDATGFASSLRDLFASYLTGPSIRAELLQARLVSQALEEARQKSCDHVLVTSVTVKRHTGGGLGRALGRVAGTAAWYGVPYGGTVASAAARGAAVAGAEAVSAMAASTQSKDEVTLEFRVGTPDAVLRAKARSEKAKASRDGEDLLTPLTSRAAEEVAAAVLKR